MSTFDLLSFLRTNPDITLTVNSLDKLRCMPKNDKTFSIVALHVAAGIQRAMDMVERRKITRMTDYLQHFCMMVSAYAPSSTSSLEDMMKLLINIPVDERPLSGWFTDKGWTEMSRVFKLITFDDGKWVFTGNPTMAEDALLTCMLGNDDNMVVDIRNVEAMAICGNQQPDGEEDEEGEEGEQPTPAPIALSDEEEEEEQKQPTPAPIALSDDEEDCSDITADMMGAIMKALAVKLGEFDKTLKAVPDLVEAKIERSIKGMKRKRGDADGKTAKRIKTMQTRIVTLEKDALKMETEMKRMDDKYIQKITALKANHSKQMETVVDELNAKNSKYRDQQEKLFNEQNKKLIMLKDKLAKKSSKKKNSKKLKKSNADTMSSLADMLGFKY